MALHKIPERQACRLVLLCKAENCKGSIQKTVCDKGSLKFDAGRKRSNPKGLLVRNFVAKCYIAQFVERPL